MLLERQPFLKKTNFVVFFENNVKKKPKFLDRVAQKTCFLQDAE